VLNCKEPFETLIESELKRRVESCVADAAGRVAPALQRGHRLRRSSRVEAHPRAVPEPRGGTRVRARRHFGVGGEAAGVPGGPQVVRGREASLSVTRIESGSGARGPFPYPILPVLNPYKFACEGGSARRFLSVIYCHTEADGHRVQVDKVKQSLVAVVLLPY
jgi:hypothetical protein